MATPTWQGWPMRWIDRLGTAQRVIGVIALGLELGILASYLTSLGRFSGWFAYVPLTGQAFQPPGTGEPGWLRLIIWLAAVVLWALASIRVLRPARGNH